MHITKINLDGLDLISDDYLFSLSGLFDFEKEITTNNLYIDGESYNRSKNKNKTLVLNGVILKYNFNTLTALNKVLSSNRLKPLIVTVDEVGELLCYVEIQNRITGDIAKLISCQLMMPDPYLYALNPDKIELGAVSNKSLIFPVIFPISFGDVTGGEGMIINRGNAIAYPVITILGICSSISISNNTTGEAMSIDTALNSDDTLIIDSHPETRGIYLNGVQRMDLKNGSWFTCPIGGNRFTFSRNSLQNNKKHCSISLQSRWI